MATSIAIQKRPEGDRLISVEEYSALTGEPKATVYSEINRGSFGIPVVRLSRRLRFWKSDVLAHINARTTFPKTGETPCQSY